MVLLGSRSTGRRLEAVKAVTERPYQPPIGPVGKPALALLVVIGLFAAFGWIIR